MTMIVQAVLGGLYFPSVLMQRSHSEIRLMRADSCDDLRSGLADAIAAGDLNRQVQLYQSALNQAPDDHRLWTNYGNVHWLLGQVDEAVAAFRQACVLNPQAVLGWRGLAHSLRDGRQFLAALHALKRARALEDSGLLAWSAGQLLLGLEQYSEGYALAEHRLTLQELELYRPPQLPAGGLGLPRPGADGVVVFSEQGFGDSLQYLRWLVQLLQQGWRVQLELEPPLAPLAAEGFRWLGSAADRLQVVAKQTLPPPLPVGTTAVLSLLSLPHHLGAAPCTDSFQPQQRGHWQGYLRRSGWTPPVSGPGPRIGVLWASGRKDDDDFLAREYRQRSLPAEVLGPLLEGLKLQGAELVNLQFGADQERADPWRHCFSAELAAGSDFLATADQARALDLVISVDTAMAHLCGAIGQQAWLLLPYAADPRWLRARSHSAWYPSLRLWRQPAPHQWQPVIQQLLAAVPAWWQQQRLS